MVRSRQLAGRALDATLRSAIFAVWPALVLAGVVTQVKLPAGAPPWMADWALHLARRVFPAVGHHGRVLVSSHWAVLFWVVLSLLFGLAYRHKSVLKSAWMSPLAFLASFLAINAALLWAGLDVLLQGP